MRACARRGKGAHPYTVLMYACMCSKVEVVKLRLERGANKELRSNSGCDAVDSWTRFARGNITKEELLALLARGCLVWRASARVPDEFR
jgi:hypothetical protein